MADWTTVDTNNLLPGEPWTSALAIAAFENVEAMSEGAPGAPRVLGKALNLLHSVETIPGSGDNFDITDLDGLDLIAILHSGLEAISTSSGTPTLRVALSDDNGSSFAAATTIMSGSSTGPGDVVLRPSQIIIGLQSGLLAFTGMGSNNGSPVYMQNDGAAALTLPAGAVNAVRISAGGSTDLDEGGIALILSLGESS